MRNGVMYCDEPCGAGQRWETFKNYGQKIRLNSFQNKSKKGFVATCVSKKMLMSLQPLCVCATPWCPALWVPPHRFTQSDETSERWELIRLTPIKFQKNLTWFPVSQPLAPGWGICSQRWKRTRAPGHKSHIVS